MENIAYILTIIVIIVLLLRHKKQFTASFTGLGKHQKITLGIISVMTLVPTMVYISFVLYTVYVLNPSDYWYKQSQTKTGYHIYRSTFPPGGKMQTSLYMPTKLANLSNATRIIYDKNIFAGSTENSSAPLILTQVGVPADFDVSSFIRTQLPAFSRHTVDVATSIDTTGTFLEKSATDAATLSVMHLIFVTVDHVLIQISSVNSPDTNLIQLANTLK